MVDRLLLKEHNITQDEIEQELAEAMADPDLGELGKAIDESMQKFDAGAILKGRCINVLGDDVIVDVGYKSEGVVPLSEFLPQGVKPGDEFEVLLDAVEDEGGSIVLSKRKADRIRGWQRVIDEHKEGDMVTGRVMRKIKGGLLVDIGVPVFLPASQIDIRRPGDIGDYIGKDITCKILKIDVDRHNIVVSRRKLIEEQREEQKRSLMSGIAVGQVRRGVVKNIADFGAFVDLGGIDGLLHITDMSWGRVTHPSEMVAIDQEIEVVVLNVDPEKEKIALGLKQRTPNPWDGVEDRYPINSRVRGRVVNLAAYGAFVEIEEGVEGLVHVSELSWTKRVAKASDVLKVGDMVDAVVLGVNPQERKISLGIRQTEANPWELVQDTYPIGARVKGKVRNFTSYGAFVELEEGVDGMIHVSDMSWTRKVNHPSEVLKKGDEVECVVLEVDPANQRISLGLKQAQEDPWSTMAAKYRVGQLVKGKVSKIASFGAFVELDGGIDGLVHISQISDERVQKVRDVLQPGQEVEARVIKIDNVERKIGLSIKAAKLPEENFVVSEDMLQGLRPGEDLVDLAGAFDEAFNASGETPREWRPGAPKEGEQSEAK